MTEGGRAFRRRFLRFLSVTIACTVAAAQDRPGPTLRPVEEAEFPNGLRLMVLAQPQAQTVTFQLLVLGAGGHYDPESARGVASLTAEMTREGTATRSARQIVELLDTMAGTLDISAGMGNQAATFSGSCLPESLDPMLGLLSDVVMNPGFPAEEIGRLRIRRKDELVQQRSSGEFLATEHFLRRVYGSHPANRLAPAPETLDRVTRDQLVDFHREHYLPDYAVLGVSGDVDLADVQKRVEAHFGSWKKRGIPRPAPLEPPEPGPPSITLVDRPGAVRSALVVGAPAVHRTHPDYDALLLLNRVLGDARTGRLVQNLRQAKGYASEAASDLTALAYRGDWRATIVARAEVTDLAIQEVLDEIGRLRDQPVPEEELGKAKRAMVAGYARSITSRTVTLTHHLVRWAYNVPEDYWGKYPERIRGLSADEIQAVARKYLDPPRLQLAAAGDAARIGEGLKRLGKVDIVNAEAVSDN
jgi:predicted Zn-dependent peptidase